MPKTCKYLPLFYHFAQSNYHFGRTMSEIALKHAHHLDSTDKKLVAALRADARASVSDLAKTLHVTRGTVQNRLDKLLRSGAILGFTIRAHDELETDVVRAVMMIEVVGRTTTQVINKLKGIPQLEKLHSTNGSWDLVAQLRTSNLQEFDRVLREVREIEGVLNSETSILLSSV